MASVEQRCKGFPVGQDGEARSLQKKLKHKLLQLRDANVAIQKRMDKAIQELHSDSD